MARRDEARGSLHREGRHGAAWIHAAMIRTPFRILFGLAFALCIVLLAPSAFAHKPSDSYLTLEVDGAKVHGRWDIAIRDLDYALDLDGDGDGKITWAELREHQQEVAS